MNIYSSTDVQTINIIINIISIILIIINKY